INTNLYDSIVPYLIRACFSPSERILYVDFVVKLVQFDLESGTGSTVLWEDTTGLPNNTTLGRGFKPNLINNKIYVCHPWWVSGWPLNVPESQYLGVIHSPD